MQNRVRLLDKPLVYVLDTPGVLNPFYKDVEGEMKLALCDLILESATHPHYVADFLLYFMNKYLFFLKALIIFLRNNDFSYVDILELSAPSNDIQQILAHICKKEDLRQTILIGKNYEDRWNFKYAVDKFLKLFRSNQINDGFLDRDKL